MQDINSYDDFQNLVNNESKLVNGKVHTFKECKFNFEFSPKGVSFDYHLSFEDCQFQKIYIEDCEFLGHFTLMNCYTSSGWMLNCKFHKLSSIHLLHYDNNSNVHNGYLVLDNCKFDQRSAVSSLKIAMNYTQGHLSIGHPNRNLKIDSLNINRFNGQLDIVERRVNSETNEPAWFSIKDFTLSTGFQGILFVHRAIIENIKIDGINTEGHFRFDMVKVKNFHISDFNNRVDGGLQLGRLEPISENSSFKIISSNLGKTHISSCDFTKFNKFMYFDSDLSQVTSNNTKWIEEISIEEDRTISNIKRDSKGDTDCLNNKENYYRTVKNILQSSGEKLGESIFRAHELNIKLQKTPWEKGQVLNKLSLYASKIFSSHGTDWLRPIIFMTVINLIIITSFNSIDNVDLGASEFFQLFNPTHKLSSFTNYELIEETWLVALDLFSRISTGYLGFQTVKAFRKFI